MYCSSNLPIIFPPLLIDNFCYCDGGILLNYPLDICIKNGAKENEILGIKMVVNNLSINKITFESSIFDYIFNIFNKLLANRQQKNNLIKKKINIEININSDYFTIQTCFDAINNVEERKRLINYGKECVEDCLKKIV